jgi:hypothetical protein
MVTLGLLVHQGCLEKMVLLGHQVSLAKLEQRAHQAHMERMDCQVNLVTMVQRVILVLVESKDFLVQ